jgi:cytochrome c556
VQEQQSGEIPKQAVTEARINAWNRGIVGQYFDLHRPTTRVIFMNLESCLARVHLINVALVTTSLLLLSTSIGAATADIEKSIEQRQATFKSMKAEVKNLKEAMGDEPADSAAVREPAEKIVANAKSLVGVFPEGSHEGDTRAKKKIWKNREDFEARQQKLIADAEQVLAASEAASEDDLKKAFKNLAKNCKGCHMRYRQVF